MKKVYGKQTKKKNKKHENAVLGDIEISVQNKKEKKT